MGNKQLTPPADAVGMTFDHCRGVQTVVTFGLLDGSTATVAPGDTKTLKVPARFYKSKDTVYADETVVRWGCNNKDAPERSSILGNRNNTDEAIIRVERPSDTEQPFTIAVLK